MQLEKVWGEYQNAIKAFLHKKVADPDDVEDLLQEILIKTHHNIASLRNQKSIKSWLYQIANHTTVDFYREKAKAKKLTDNQLWFEQEDANIKKEFSACIAPFIAALPEENAQILADIDLNGESQKEYAAKLGVSYSTFKSRVQKSREMLKQLFDDCCHFSVDAKGNLVDYQQKSEHCKNCK